VRASLPLRRPTAARRGFTLVELVTAASLMTVMMLGVIQIFRIVTRTAGDAEAVHFAQQQARCLMDRLRLDIRGLSRDGYLRIVKTGVPVSTGPYSADTLAMTTIGERTGIASGGIATKAAAAEVLYTSHVPMGDDGAVPYVQLGAAYDLRRGVLARGEWLIAGRAGSSQDRDDISAAAYLSTLYAQPTQDRISKAGTTTHGRGQVRIWPWKEKTGQSDVRFSLRRVMASCVSEFCVEYFDPVTDKWVGGAPTVFGQDLFYYAGKAAPPAIRVTAALHDPDDRSSPPIGAPAAFRFAGYAVQETYWITDW